MSVPYRTLFLLEADTTYILEIKRLDVQSANPADVYSWLRFDKATQMLELLEFVSMTKADGEQQREFQQGSLRFTPTQGQYQPIGGSAPLALRVLAPAELPDELDAAVQQFLASRPAN
ncbi:hypothetical protein [Hymenobacter guriensis]|uniref:Uncharacterized protein n=1 Tax=Hymenobacter guriensis TaxID=2793065 RepID=A0ABS0L947_9BACT|nr:hypothetical protein [Hymenobacter guriensis]MBG8555962.1 hypothetical protein [Hymenobacter guriensis]